MNTINKWIKLFCFLSVTLTLVVLMGCTATENLSPSTSVANSTSSTSISTTNPSNSQVSTSTSSTPTTNNPSVLSTALATTSYIQSTTPPTTNDTQSIITTQVGTPTSSSISSTTLLTTNLPASTTITTSTVVVPHPVMQFTSEQLTELDNEYKNAPASSVHALENGVPLPKSVSLLPDLDYNPTDYNQGNAGNCWVWAGTGIMDIALDINKSIKNRLSIQYFDSNYDGGTGPYWAGKGGGIFAFANFYANQGIAIPWSNTNARYQDGDSTNGASVLASSIGLSPNYPISPSIHNVTIFPQGVSQTTAITAIENTLAQNEGVWFSFFLSPTGWSNFDSFWNNQSETSIWQPPIDSNNNSGGHAVLCVGYNIQDPNNPYWIMLNSWGPTSGRPDDLFDVSMNMNYNSNNFQWETLEDIYPTTPFPTPTTTTTSKTTYTGTPNMIFNSASTETVPSSGIYLQPGQTITLSWQADGNLTGYVFSSNQYNNWQQSHLYVTYDASQSGSTYSYSYTVQNADTYYIVLYDGASVFGNSVRDYSFTVTISSPTTLVVTTTNPPTTTVVTTTIPPTTSVVTTTIPPTTSVITTTTIPPTTIIITTLPPTKIITLVQN
jgi:hypothetical protein